MITLVLSQSILAAQNTSVYDATAHPGPTSAALGSSSTQPFQTYQEENIGNLSAVENWHLPCTRELGNRYSLEAQQLGRSYAQQVETTSRLITDAGIAEYLNRIGQNLARNSQAQVQLTVKIIDTDDLNAFALPTGLIFVDSGLILAADNEAELAAVISHEIAHMAGCHAARAIAREELTSIASMPLIFRLVFRRAIQNTVYLKPDRSYEFEADFLGIEYLYKAGYDPRAITSILEKLTAIEKQKGSPGSLESHSLMTDRIKRTRQKINTLSPPAAEYKLDTSQFQEMKKRLSELRNRQTSTRTAAQMVLN
jgi:predicted Zn-dependent protease